ncbi:lysM domain receptor-like kinase 3 isoform X2 [Cornus florida]|uniref:lysM domain receptor-like kinase 3 isoform X2 n=1 Tax=Cornus florida TaxID=4283 RepID=UPI0028995D4D|nr:lysM domain receptor-like kinase 3 isoform X2 [Cornus florida]
MFFKSKKSTDVMEPNHSNSRISTTASRPSLTSRRSADDYRSQKSPSEASTSLNYTTGSSYYKESWRSSISSPTSLSTLRDSLAEHAHIYEFSEICSATGNFLAKRFASSSSSAAWRCAIRGREVIVYQRKLRRPMAPEELRERLSLICKSHHSSLIKLHGASISGNYIYLVYDYVHGANLSDCLRNPKNPNFTVLSNWMSRMQIASDLSHGLDYIHHCTGLNRFVHNHIKSSSIIVTDESLNAKICHFGTSELCGEIDQEANIAEKSNSASKLKRTNSKSMKLEGTRGYMSPEFQFTGSATQKSDVYAFGVVILELLSGDEPLKYEFDDNGGYKRLSVIETAREAVDGGGGGKLRWWVDKRLKDSYPVEVAEKLARVGLECVEDDPVKRPDMGWIAGRISKLYLESKAWAESMGVLTDFSVSLAPR